MKAIILAAGRGSRMGDATSEQPKCLTKLAGKELLEWQLEALRKAEIKQISIVRGYMHEKILKDGCTYFENKRWAETNMVMSLMCASEWLKTDECIVSYSDIVYPADTISKLFQAQGDIVISYNTEWRKLWEMRFNDPLSDAETFRINRQGVLLEIGNRPVSLEEVQGQYMGLLKITPKGWENILKYIATGNFNKTDITTLLKGLLSQGIKIDTVSIQGNWLEVDSGEDLRKYESQFNKDDDFAFLRAK